ncbi:hypothetical protein MKW94_019764 [Papaver nudicaule]|uniref:Uncharacterized protein n=1 Tax=Papaver nudicaule TaxID=74823 RepID=A0AA41VNY2_PAPNU|nr:hypothetical protein [Papaver nudicaule]
MGSEKKSSRKRSSPSASSEEDKVKSDKRHKNSSTSTSHRDKDKKSHKHSKHSDNNKVKKSEEKSDQKRRRHKLLSGEELSKEDYFVRNNEFSTWLKEEKRIFFSSLSSEASHDLFLDFIKVWNKGKLEERYYKGISTAPRTAHNWNIRSEKVS